MFAAGLIKGVSKGKLRLYSCFQYLKHRHISSVFHYLVKKITRDEQASTRPTGAGVKERHDLQKWDHFDVFTRALEIETV